jgi:hypothetical protein
MNYRPPSSPVGPSLTASSVNTQASRLPIARGAASVSYQPRRLWRPYEGSQNVAELQNRRLWRLCEDCWGVIGLPNRRAPNYPATSGTTRRSSPSALIASVLSSTILLLWKTKNRSKEQCAESAKGNLSWTRLQSK